MFLKVLRCFNADSKDPRLVVWISHVTFRTFQGDSWCKGVAWWLEMTSDLELSDVQCLAFTQRPWASLLLSHTHTHAPPSSSMSTIPSTRTHTHTHQYTHTHTHTVCLCLPPSVHCTCLLPFSLHVVFQRPFVRRIALCYGTVVCLSVCL